MIALDFPPCHSAGVQRTLSFVNHLPQSGWEPIILTAMPAIYDNVSGSYEGDSQKVFRAFGLNTLKHLSFKGKHFAWMTKPDRFFSWYWHAVHVGKAMIKEFKPDIIWSTFPCSTTMKIAGALQKDSGLPWVADFRDPFSGVNPYVRVDNKPGAEIDEYTVLSATQLVFSTDKTAELYKSFYSGLRENRVNVITNGFNEHDFREAVLRVKGKRKNPTFTLLHSGTIYPVGRDPHCLLDAISELRNKTNLLTNAQVLFRGARPSAAIDIFLKKEKLEEVVLFKAAISFEDSIDEMLMADVLVLLQGEMFNNQIPGKAYEYLRSGKPILALTHSEGATASLLRSFPGVYLADMNSKTDAI